MSSGIVVERDGPVGTVRIDRPEVHNALNAAVLGELDRAITALVAEGVGAIVLTGSGTRSFCAGADLDELRGLQADQAYDLLRAGQSVISHVERSPVPVIAAVNGLALGGGFELMLACTFPILSQTAELGLPETGLGLIPGYGGTQRLARRVGSALAAYTIITGERIAADRAYVLGLTPVPPVPSESLEETAREVARRICARGPRAIRAAMLAVRHGSDGPLDAGLALESALAGVVTAGEEAAEGIEAFKARRAPSFGAADDDRGGQR